MGHFMGEGFATYLVKNYDFVFLTLMTINDFWAPSSTLKGGAIEKPTLQLPYSFILC